VPGRAARLRCAPYPERMQGDRAAPDVGNSTVDKIFTSVVLPALFGPKSPRTSPGLTVKLTLSSATTCPGLPSRSRVFPGRKLNVRVSSCTSIAGVVKSHPLEGR
jgi:hypothetical protein